MFLYDFCAVNIRCPTSHYPLDQFTSNLLKKLVNKVFGTLLLTEFVQLLINYVTSLLQTSTNIGQHAEIIVKEGHFCGPTYDRGFGFALL